jgi:DNA-3-methyladenine glycosylase II
VDPRAAVIAEDAAHLARRDRRLHTAAGVAGPLQITLRPEGFGTIARLILEQQVSLGAGRAMFKRLSRARGATPEGFLSLDEATLRACGFSRQKAGYAADIAAGILDGSIDLFAIGRLGDDAARAALVGVRGIGPWTADNYLLWALGRRDVLPRGDLALVRGWSWLTGAPEHDGALQSEAEAWRPRRSAAAFLIWEYYLATRDGRTGGAG